MTTTRSRRSIIGGAVLLVTLVAAACGSDVDGVRGSGDVQTDERAVSGFDEILLEGGGSIVVDVSGTESLRIEADDNLLPLLSSEVRGRRLELRTRESIAPSQPVVYTIGAVAFEGISIVGSVDLVATNLDCTSFDASIAGAGDLDLTGECDRLELSITGTGGFAGEAFEVATADIDISGSGNVVVNATDELVVRITGSGDVAYLGDPSTDIDIAGSGDVRKL
ncbi:GIN domain-containing protein [Ilumatobacter sp.]|uniref:GIN domain-containing protein n=1 Tax=Ilumatobacter sp. TaxID=1967498 RepID=UPI003AF500CC